MIRQDYIKRLIEQLAQAVARLAGQKVDDVALVEEIVRDVKGKLPIVPYLLDDLSPKALRSLLASDEVALVVARLFVVEGLLHERKSDARRAALGYKRGIRLFLLCGGEARHAEHAEVFRDAAARLSSGSLTQEEREGLGLARREA